MFKKIAVYISTHVAQLVGAVASVTLAAVLGYAAIAGTGSADFLGDMAWEKNVYENNQAYGTTTYEAGEVDESDNRLHEDEGRDEGMNNDTQRPPDDESNQGQDALLAGNTVKSDNSQVVTDDTNVVADPNNAHGTQVVPGAGGGSEGDGPGTGGSGGEGGNPGDGSGGEGGNPGGSTTPPISDEQQGQLNAKDDFVDNDGNHLVALDVKVPANWIFARGEDYRPDGVTVTATFKDPKGKLIEREIPYGGKDGYAAYLSKAWTSGTHDATFIYGGLSAHAVYSVLNKRYDVSYGSYASDLWYAARFPGPGNPDDPKNTEPLDYFDDSAMSEVSQRIQDAAIPENLIGGFFTDLTDAHRFMITALDQKRIYNNFQNSGNRSYQTVRFLQPFDAGEGVNLTRMAVGFVTQAESKSEEGLAAACVYKPSEEGDPTASVGVLLAVADVPQDFHVQRKAGTQDNDFLGDQVMVGYIGDATEIEVPMGVTKVALTERNDKVTRLIISESVLDIDFASITKCFPNLEHIQVGENNSQTFSSYQGVLYSANGLRVLYVPSKHVNMEGNARSWSPYAETIAEGALANCNISTVVVPDQITTLEKNCFADSTIGTLSFRGETPVKGMAQSGYQGEFYVPDSAYDTVCKRWVASLGETNTMRVGTQGTGSGAGDGSGSGAGSGGSGSSGAGTGDTSGVVPGTYIYNKQFNAVVLAAEPTVLVGAAANAPKVYTIADGVSAVGEGAFVASSQIREILVPESVKQFRAHSLVGLSAGTKITILGTEGGSASVGGSSGGSESSGAAAGVIAIDNDAFGGGSVPDITVYVPSACYGDYLRVWSAALGADVAQRILQVDDQTYRYINNAKYLVLNGNSGAAGSSVAVPRMRLIEVYDEGQTFFEPAEGTVEIADGAFAGCASLEIVHIPASVTSVGANNLFDGCTNLESVLVDSAQGSGINTGEAALYRPNASTTYDYDSATGILYSRDTKGAFTLINVPTDTTTVAIKANTVKLGDEAFKGCASLADSQDAVTFETPETLISVGAYCFDGCTSVQDVDMSAFSALQTVGDFAFANCSGLQTVVLPDQIASLGKGAFMGCTSLTHCVALGLTELSAQAFRDCKSLQLIQAPNVTVIRDECFYGCEKLEMVEKCIATDAKGVYKDALSMDKITWVGDRAFAYCVSFAQNSNAVFDMKSLQHIGVQAFRGCQSLRAMVLPTTLTEMGEEAFRDCVALTTIEANSSLSTIGRYSFYGCVNLTTLTLSPQQQEKLEVIGACAFANCAILERLDLSTCSKLAYLGDRAFEQCPGLLRITLPKSLTKVSDRCFNDCPNLSIVELSSETPTALGESVFGEQAPEYLRIWVCNQQAYDNYLKAYKPLLDPRYGGGFTQFVLELRSDTSETLRGITYTATEDGKWVVTDALPNLSGSVMLSHDVAAVGPEAFKGCDKLKNVQFEYGASISLGDRAFEGCNSLEEVSLYGSIPEWGDSVFAGCKNLTSLIIGGSATDDYIPRVGSRAFAGCSALPMVTFRSPTGIIDEEAFADCTSIEQIASTKEFRASLTEYGDRAFINCTSLIKGVLSSSYKGLEAIGEEAFYNCDALNSAAVPVNVKSLGKACFAECDNITTLSVYGGLEEIPVECLKNCPKLLKVGGTPAAFAGLKTIGTSAFEGCVALEITGLDAAHPRGDWSLSKYTNLVSIGDKAFSGAFNHQHTGYGNPRLDTITLAATLEHIGAGAFDGAVGLTRITLQSTPTLGANAFVHMADAFTLEVPQGTYDAYLPVLAASVGKDTAARMLYDASRAAAAAISEEEAAAAGTTGEEAAAGKEAAAGRASAANATGEVAAANAPSKVGSQDEGNSSAKETSASSKAAGNDSAGNGSADGGSANASNKAADKTSANSASADSGNASTSNATNDTGKTSASASVATAASVATNVAVAAGSQV